MTLGPEIPSVSDPLPGARERERVARNNNHGNQKSPGVTPRRTNSQERLQRQVLIWNNNLPSFLCVAGLARLIR